MANYIVKFIQEWIYEVEAQDEYEAEDVAYEQFKATMTTPIANTSYSDVIISEYDEEDGQWYTLD